jgi:general secretion pathway protein G
MQIKQKGFTIVELLIVVVVIGILAAIVVVAYNGVTSSTHESAVKNDLSSFAKKMEVYKATNGDYPSNGTELDDADVKVTQGSYLIRNNFYYCRSDDGQHYAVGVWSINSIRYWLIDGVTTQTTDNVYGSSTCDQLDPHAHPAGVNAFGYHNDGAGWQSWTE